MRVFIGRQAIAFLVANSGVEQVELPCLAGAVGLNNDGSRGSARPRCRRGRHGGRPQRSCRDK